MKTILITLGLAAFCLENVEARHGQAWSPTGPTATCLAKGAGNGNGNRNGNGVRQCPRDPAKQCDGTGPGRGRCRGNGQGRGQGPCRNGGN
ncbi:hypothetical protein [Haloferula sargassicola]|uniref:Secreted protein n=1 Tax=Haloferula sargassicola TaxID=490096 RepID=A0ABP9UKC9_9BACT